MPVQRQYVRLSPAVACEIRIHIDDADAAWYRERRGDILSAIRPFLPSRLEDKQHSRNRDTVHGEGFTATLYVVNTATPHVIMRRSKKLVFPEAAEEEDGDAKPQLRVRYFGYKIHGRAVVVTVGRTEAAGATGPIRSWIEASQQNGTGGDID